MDEIIKQIIEWGNGKGINNPEKQFQKLAEEMLEAHTEYRNLNALKGTLLHSSHFYNYHFDKLEMELGDIGVVWILLCNMLNVSPLEALEAAHNKNKDRKGKTINGSFVKEEDLDEVNK